MTANESRVLVLAPPGKDTMLILDALQREGIQAEACRHGAELAAAVRFGAGAVLVAEESLADAEGRAALQAVIHEQPAWSDLPLLLMPTAASDDTLAKSLGNVTLLARPAQTAAVVSAVTTALRGRQRQYEARTTDEHKDAFIARLAHELRNPLAPLGHAVALLRRDDLAPALRQRALEVAERQTQQLTRLADDLLDFARISQGRASLQRSQVDLGEVMKAALKTSQPRIEAMQHTLVTRLPMQAVRLSVDATRLAQCIANLLDNAAKFSPRASRIELSAEVDGPEILIEVRDHGVGIPAAALPGLFDAYGQADAAAAPDGGLRVGLAIVKTYVELHGGSVGAYSEGEGRGSTFILRMPRGYADALQPGRGARTDDLPAIAACSVLVVDDNVDSADSLCEFLSLYGHRVTVAYTGQAGWEAALRDPPDAAVLDIGLPDIDGLQLAQRLRACPTTAHARLIALSGWGQAADHRRSAEAGFDQHLVKPADLEQVLAGIAAVHRPGGAPLRPMHDELAAHADDGTPGLPLAMPPHARTAHSIQPPMR
jgi:signal transduction histidine kinase/DNA-binding NarL/FixJ family response regulator